VALTKSEPGGDAQGQVVWGDRSDGDTEAIMRGTETGAHDVTGRRSVVVLLALLAIVVGLLPAVPAVAAEPEVRPASTLCEPPYQSSFVDIAGSAHEDNVLCLADLGITEGTGDGTSYSPRRPVTRAQMASFIARYIEHYTGATLSTGQARFDDVPRVFAHHDNIHKLLAAGVTAGTAASGGTSYAPQQLVTRAQMASFISRANSYIEDGTAVPEHQPPRTTTDRFPDDDGSVHEPNIDALAAVRIVEGFTDGTYRPANPVLRDQMASFLVRSYAWALGVGLGEPTTPDPEPGVVSGTVTEAGVGTSIAGAEVRLTNGESHVTTTLGDGTYTVVDVTPGSYTISAAADGYAPASQAVEVGAGALVTVDLALTPIPQEYDVEVTVPLRWQNQYREDAAAFGGVDDYAAFHHDDERAGEVTLRWNEGAGVVATEGEVTLTSRAEAGGFALHAGALDAEGPMVIELPAPTFAGAAGEEPGSGEGDRGRFTYTVDGAVSADRATLDELGGAIAAGGTVDWYVNLATAHNPAGEVRGQLGDDGGLADIVPQFEYFEFHELGEGTNTGEDQTSFNLWFDADIAFAGATGQLRPQPGDFVLTINGEEHEILRVRGDNPDWQPYPKQDVRIHLDTHEVVEDGDVAEITLSDSGAQKLRPVGRNSGADDLSESWRTRCTRIISVDAMTSEPCGTPPQAGLADYAVTPIVSAPAQEQTFSVTIEEPGLPAGEELWIDLGEASFDGLVDYSGSTWTATVDGVATGTAEFWEYEETERFQTIWEPFLRFSHGGDAPVAGELVLSGTDVDASDAAVHGDDTTYDSYVVRRDTGRADYAEIEVRYEPQPTLALTPADAVVLAGDGAELAVTATSTDVDGEPVSGSAIRFWAEQGERPDVELVELGTETTGADGRATVTYAYDGRTVGVGAPLVDRLRAEVVADPFVDGRTTVAWATGVATNGGPGDAAGATYHDLNDAVVGADAGDTITAVGTFSSLYGLPRGDRVHVTVPDLTLQATEAGATLRGAVDLRASGVALEGFTIEQAGGMAYAVRIEGSDITLAGNDIDADGADGVRVRDAWGPVPGGGSATIADNTITGAAIGIDVDNRDQAGALVTDLAITGNEFVDAQAAIHYGADGGTVTIADNGFVAGDRGDVYVRDATEAEDLDLEALLSASDNRYDPDAEILGRSIVPIDPAHTPSMVRVVEHGTGQGKQYTVIEYTRGVAGHEDGAAVGSQFTLDRGTERTPNRVGVDVDFGWNGRSDLIRITWDGNPSFPNAIHYEEHVDPTYRVHNAYATDSYAVSPDQVGSPFPKPADDAAVSGAVYFAAGGVTIDGRSFAAGTQVEDVDLEVRISDRSEPANLRLVFDGARPGEDFTTGEDICAELLTTESCQAIQETLAAHDPFTGDQVFLDGASLALAEDAAPGDWQLRWWVVDADDGEVYFADTYTLTVVAGG
jgi:hypothetical protein